MANHIRPWGVDWRSKPSFVIATVALGLFSDHFLYGIVVPVIPFVLRDRLSLPETQIQSHTSLLLAAYAGAAVTLSIPAGCVIDKIRSRQTPFVAGLVFLIVATTMLAFGQSVAALAVARLLQGMSAAIVWTAGLAMVQDTVGPGKMGQVTGAIVSFTSVGELVSPVLGGILYDKAGIRAVFGVAIGILLIDLTMRLLVIDNKMLAIYNSPHLDGGSDERSTVARVRTGAQEARECDALLPNNDSNEYKITVQRGSLARVVPIVYCFREPRLLMALLLSFVQSLLIGAFDSTIPIEAESLFHFSSLKVGFVFIALLFPYLALGPIAGAAVDRLGTKVVATAGYAFLSLCLLCLGLPSQKLIGGLSNIILFCAVLALNGVGLSIIGSPGFVEATNATQRYEAANPGFFGGNGPYAQLYGFYLLFAFSGLTVGPLLAAMLRLNFGYGTMGVAFAALSGVTAVLSFVLIGDKRDTVQRDRPSTAPVIVPENFPA